MAFKPKHILVAVAVGAGDENAAAEALVDSAVDLAIPLGARLTLLYASVPSGPAMPVDPALAGTAYDAMLAVLEANRSHARRALDALKDRAVKHGVTVDVQMLEPVAGVGELVADTAKALGADLLMLCSHGRRGLKRVLLGSVADRVAHLSPVPVLIFHTPPATPGGGAA